MLSCAGLAARTLKRSSIAEQDVLLIVHNLTRNVQTYAVKARAGWIAPTIPS
jgi:hypothetical protein